EKSRSCLQINPTGILANNWQLFFLAVNGIENTNNPEDEQSNIEQPGEESYNWNPAQNADTDPGNKQDQSLLDVEHDEWVILRIGEQWYEEQDVSNDRHSGILLLGCLRSLGRGGCFCSGGL